MRVSWVLAISIFSATASAQTTPTAKPTITVGDFDLWPTLEVRTRGEYRHEPVDMGGAGSGYYTEDPWAVMERTRLGLGAERGALRAQVTFQDARVWGATPPTGIFSNDAFASTGLYEGYIEIHTTNPPGLKPGTEATTREREPQYIRVGRQAIVWDGGHLLGNADFSPVARTFDAVRAHAGWRSLDFEAFAAIADAPRPIGLGFDDPNGSYYGGTQLYGALASLTLDPLFRAQLYGLLRPAPGQSSTTFTPLASEFAQSRDFGDDWTIALGLGGDSKGWKYGVTGAIQLGQVQLLGAKVDRLAGAVVGEASRRFDGVVLTPTIAVGGSFASGGRSATQYNQFDPLYPDVQAFHGMLGAFAWSNLIDAHGTVSIVPTANFKIAADYRYARTVAPSTGEWLDTYLVVAGNASGTTSQELGHEVDLLVSYRPWPALDIAAGYSLLILGDGAKQMMAAENRGPADFSHYAFVQLTLNVPAKP